MNSTRIFLSRACIAAVLVALIPGARSAPTTQESTAKLDFPKSTGTPSVECGRCHQAIYREYAFGFGTDLAYKPMASQSTKDGLMSLKERVSAMGAAHSISGIDPWPLQARGHEVSGKPCNVCHYPEPFDIPELDALEIARPKPRSEGQAAEGVTCATCHLTPDGKIRGPYGAEAPHKTIKEPRMQTSAACAFCHSSGKRSVGKSTQTFLEWRDDYYKAGLGSLQCQDCHMTRTLRKLAEDGNWPVRPVARHNWTGGHSTQRISSALSMVIVADEKNEANMKFHVINVGTGHSVPTGSGRRAIFLQAEAVNTKGRVVAAKEWMFSPNYGDRPDDKAFLEEDKKRSDAIQAMQADDQGPHESIIRAGEERILEWEPKLAEGTYTIRAALIYDLNRYNNPNFEGDRTRTQRSSVSIRVK